MVTGGGLVQAVVAAAPSTPIANGADAGAQRAPWADAFRLGSGAQPPDATGADGMPDTGAA